MKRVLIWVAIVAIGCSQPAPPRAASGADPGLPPIAVLIAKLDGPSGGVIDTGADVVFRSDADVAAGKLAAIGKPAVGPLVAELLNPPGWRRTWAARILGTIGEPRAWQPLANLLPHGGSTRPAIIEALGKLHDPRAVPLLEPLLPRLGIAGEPHMNVSREVGEGYLAGLALGELGAAGRSALLRALHSKEHCARENALRGLAVHPMQSDAPEAKRLTRDADARVREAARRLLDAIPRLRAPVRAVARAPTSRS